MSKTKFVNPWQSSDKGDVFSDKWMLLLFPVITLALASGVALLLWLVPQVMSYLQQMGI